MLQSTGGSLAASNCSLGQPVENTSLKGTCIVGVTGGLRLHGVVADDACFLFLSLGLNRQRRVFKTSSCFNLSVCGVDDEDGFGLRPGKIFFFTAEQDEDKDEGTKDRLRRFLFLFPALNNFRQFFSVCPSFFSFLNVGFRSHPIGVQPSSS